MSNSQTINLQINRDKEQDKVVQPYQSSLEPTNTLCNSKIQVTSYSFTVATWQETSLDMIGIYTKYLYE